MWLVLVVHSEILTHTRTNSETLLNLKKKKEKKGHQNLNLKSGYDEPLKRFDCENEWKWNNHVGSLFSWVFILKTFQTTSPWTCGTEESNRSPQINAIDKRAFSCKRKVNELKLPTQQRTRVRSIIAAQTQLSSWKDNEKTPVWMSGVDVVEAQRQERTQTVKKQRQASV